MVKLAGHWRSLLYLEMHDSYGQYRYRRNAFADHFTATAIYYSERLNIHGNKGDIGYRALVTNMENSGDEMCIRQRYFLWTVRCKSL